MNYACTRCGDDRMFDDDIHYAVVRVCNNCGGGYYAIKQEEAKEGDEEE